MAEWSGKTRGGAFGYLFFIGLIRMLGVAPAYIFCSLFVVPYFILFAPKATKNIWFYVRKIQKMGRLSSFRLLFLNYYRMGQILIDKIAIGNGMKDKFTFKFENYNEFLDILNSDKEVIIIGAHVGNWEIGTPFFEDYNKKINIVLYDAEYQKIKDIMNENSATADFRLIPVNNDGLEHVFKIKDALTNGEPVCFQGDRFVNEERVLETSFMGKRADFPMGPFLIASKLKTTVVFYFAMREKKRIYRFHFMFAEPIEKQKGVRTEQLLLEQYTNALEKIMKKYPEQWFNYYRFWKE
jgi:predicted LPLAT superfamily acyltransferase